jgi:hypothetical protein
MTERVRARAVSWMEIALHLHRIPILTSSFVVREIWPTNSDKEKGSVDGGRLTKGVEGGADLRQYLLEARVAECGGVLFAGGCHASKRRAPRGASGGGWGWRGGRKVIVSGVEKDLECLVMPPRARSEIVLEIGASEIILRRQAFQREEDVWDVRGGEEAWEGACRVSCLGDDARGLRGRVAAKVAGDAVVAEVMRFEMAMGRTDDNREEGRRNMEESIAAGAGEHSGAQGEEGISGGR